MSDIISTHELAEEHWDGKGEPGDVRSDIVATDKPTGEGIEFTVSMRDYTKRDMEEMIVEAAARVLVGQYGNNKLAKLIEERCIALTTEKTDRHLSNVTAEIIDQPLTPRYPFMKPDEKPMSMREFIALTGREYLTAYVDGSGKPTTDRHYGKARIQHLTEIYMQRVFKAEIEKATNATISEIQIAIRSQYGLFLDAEKKRIREALERAIASA